jgi:hypothetical protein
VQTARAAGRAPETTPRRRCGGRFPAKYRRPEARQLGRKFHWHRLNVMKLAHEILHLLRLQVDRLEIRVHATDGIEGEFPKFTGTPRQHHPPDTLDNSIFLLLDFRGIRGVEKAAVILGTISPVLPPPRREKAVFLLIPADPRRAFRGNADEVAGVF